MRPHPQSVTAAVARLLTGHYAPQDVIDVCKAATQQLHVATEATPWVSTKQRLPLNGQRVIARYTGVYDYRIVEFWYNKPPAYHFGSPNEPDGKGSQPATHWMPLPKPPESEASEEKPSFTEVLKAGRDHPAYKEGDPAPPAPVTEPAKPMSCLACAHCGTHNGAEVRCKYPDDRPPEVVDMTSDSGWTRATAAAICSKFTAS